MANTKNKTLRVGRLHLDPRNTRIPPAHRSEDERALIHELVEHEDVAKLAASISEKGLFPNERLVVIPAKGRSFTVLEGNRRLAAIKLLLNPELAQKPSQVAPFRKLARTADLLGLGELDTVVFETRRDAAAMIAALHVGATKKRWDSLPQARFYKELYDEGLTASEVAEELGTTLADVYSRLRIERLYRLALTLDYSEEVKEKLEDRGFSLTTLERLVESRTGRQFLGVEPDGEDFRGRVHPERLRAVLQKVASDVATVKGMTRRINTEEDVAKYVADTEKSLPKTPKRGKFSVRELLGESNGEEPTKEPPKPLPKRAPHKSKSVTLSAFALL